MKTKIVRIDATQPNRSELRQLSVQLLRGDVIAFPTETVYGLAACVKVPEAVKKLYAIKKRSASKPFSYHVGSVESLERLHVLQSAPLRYLISKFWPGPVTFLALNRKDEKVGLRFPDHPIARALLEQCIEPIVATSANLSGGKPLTTAQEVAEVFDDQVDTVIDGGACELEQASTVVDVVQSPPKIVRKGARANEVEAAIKKIRSGEFPRKKILMVCTGNSCRSPMAEAWLRSELKRKGLATQIEVSSCGVCARDGAAAAMETVLTLKNDEVEIGDFSAHLCNRQDLIYSDLIIAMADEHKRYLENLYPPSNNRIVVLDIADPIGMSIEMYQKSYEGIQQKILAMWEEIIK